jgi:hypothetical protein
VETKVETIGEKIRFDGRKLLKSLARPEGFEPPTLRSQEKSKSFYELLRDNVALIFLDFSLFGYLARTHIRWRDGHIVDTFIAFI